MPIELTIKKLVTVDAQSATGAPQPITLTQDGTTLTLTVEGRTYTLSRDDLRQALRELARDVTIAPATTT